MAALRPAPYEEPEVAGTERHAQKVGRPPLLPGARCPVLLLLGATAPCTSAAAAARRRVSSVISLRRGHQTVTAILSPAKSLSCQLRSMCVGALVV